MYDIIDKKRNKEVLTKAEIEYFVKAYTDGDIPDYQASALLMAICINGMSDEETFDLTNAMLHSGKIIHPQCRLKNTDKPNIRACLCKQVNNNTFQYAEYGTSFLND